MQAIINNGLILVAKGDLVHLRNINGVQMVFECVNIDNGYCVLEPLDMKRFGHDANRINEFITGKAIIKGVITHGRK